MDTTQASIPSWCGCSSSSAQFSSKSSFSTCSSLSWEIPLRKYRKSRNKHNWERFVLWSLTTGSCLTVKRPSGLQNTSLWLHLRKLMRPHQEHGMENLRQLNRILRELQRALRLMSLESRMRLNQRLMVFSGRLKASSCNLNKFSATSTQTSQSSSIRCKSPSRSSQRRSITWKNPWMRQPSRGRKPSNCSRKQSRSNSSNLAKSSPRESNLTKKRRMSQLKKKKRNKSETCLLII